MAALSARANVAVWKIRLERWSNAATWVMLALVACAGAWARWRYIGWQVFHVDEFISMLSVQMIIEKGVPVLPSGLYYDHGLAFSYIGAAMAWLAGGDLLSVRWWSLIVSLLAMIAAFILSRQLFEARWWGLAAATAMAWFPEAIEWGGRVRMYGQANLVLLIWIVLAWRGTLGGGHGWARWLLIAALWLGLNTHFVLILAVPALALALALVWLISGQKKIVLSQVPWRLVIESSAMLIVLAFSVWTARGGFMARYAVESSALDPDVVMVGNSLTSKVLDVALDGARWARMGRYLSKDTLLPLSALALCGVLTAVVRAVRRQVDAADLAALFIALLLTGILVEMLVFLSDEWRATRYNFLLVFPLIPPLAVYGLRSTAVGVKVISHRGAQWIRPLALAVLVALGFGWPLSAFWPETTRLIAGDISDTNQYNLALAYVDEMRAPEDRLVTIRPEAGYLFSDRLDYYANQVSPVIMPNGEGWVDRYAGVPYLAGVEDLNHAMSAPGSLWFVVDTGRLVERFEPAFTQQVFQRMAIVSWFGNVLVLCETPESWPLAKDPQQMMTADWADSLQLVGYSWKTSPVAAGETVFLTLFWKADERLLAYKVFVHLRDSAGNTVAQADFVPLERMEREWRYELVSQAQQEQVRLATALVTPPTLPAGEYTVWIGLYDAQTLIRLPVVDDMSGENAVLLGELTVMAGQ